MFHMTDDEIAEDAKARTPAAAADIDAMGIWGCSKEEQFEEVIREDVEKLRKEKALEGVEIRGLEYDLADGSLRVVE